MPVMSTDEAEGAQALFCYIADTLGTRKTNQEFKHYLNEVKKAPEFFDTHKSLIDRAFNSNAVKTAKSKDTIVKYIEENPDWFLSSLSVPPIDSSTQSYVDPYCRTVCGLIEYSLSCS